jgi:pSer/pThr/pTyr-binding forkhead associated (FHA) protein
VITCPKCSKDNQDHYKFCLGCGAELPRDAAPKPFTPQTPPQGMKAQAASASVVAAAPVAPPSAPAPAPAPVAPAPAPAPGPGPGLAPPPQAAAAIVVCPQCGHNNNTGNLFCGSCGFRLGGAAAASVAAQPPPPAAGGGPSGVVLTALRADGSEAGTFAVPTAIFVVGRDVGGIFAGDSYLSPKHATFRREGPRLSIKDEGSLNGVYKKLARDVPVELKPNDVFRIGQEIIKYEALTPEPASADGVERLGSPSKGYVGRIALVIGRDTTGNAFPIPDAGIHLGRERGDVLFPEDGYVSGLHCRLSWEGGKLFMTDLGSSNGSFIRLKEETDVKTGDVLLMGQQLFRVALS